ncbi:hypothetical protein BY996DRAFT_6415960 [Phakopsora pachyrhizi]|nr:hypothetical protein BY996DRAFT_6415960 [Phakopsora pachyrhizi]
MTKTTLQYSYEGEEGPSPELDDKKLLDNSFQLISRLEKLSRSNLPNLAKHHQLRLSLEMVKIIFLKTFEPSWAFIRDWILYGALPDPHQNFFIEPDPNFKDQLNLDDWWAKSYRIKDSFERVAPEDTLEGQEQPIRSRSSVVPRFLEFMKHEILEAGRSRILLDRLNLKLDTDDAGFGDDGNKLWIRFEDLVLKKEVCELSRRENRIRSNNHCHRSSLLFSSARFRNGWPSRSSEEQEKDTSNVDEEDNKEYFEFELKKIVEDYLRPKLELIYRTLDSKVIQGSSSSHTLADHLGKVGSSSSRRREMVGLKEYIIEFNNFYLSEGGGLMESDLIESIFQKRFSDLNGTGSGFDRTDTDELNLMMIKSFETQRPSKLIMDCMPRLMLVKDESDGFSKEKKSERGGNHLREDEEMILMIDFRNVSIPVNYVINPRSILKRGYDQIFHRIYLSYRFLKIRFDRLMIDRLKSTKSNYEKTRKGLGCQTSLKGAVKEGKSLGVDLMGLMVVRINWFLNLIKEYYFDLIIKNWKNHITKFFSASYDNLNHDGGLCPRPEGRRRFGERKFIEIIRFVEKSFRELELFLFLNEHKRSGFCVRAKVEKLFKTIEEVLRILAHKDQEPPQEKRERFGSGQLRMRREALGVKVGLEGLRVRFERLIKELESEIYRTEKGLNCKNINMRQIEKEDERTDEMDCIDGGGSDTAESCFVGVGVECLKILKFRLVDEFI